MTLTERVEHYVQSGFKRTIFVGEDRRISGTWVMGNDYRVKSGYHGGYPNTYLRRVKALFPDKRQVLHLFSGRVDTTILPGATVDINPALRPDIVDDAQTLCKVALEDFDLVTVDPPYTDEDANHYGTTMIKRNKVMRALERTRPGCHIVWLDQMLVMYRKLFFRTDGYIGVVRSTNHRVRECVIFRRRRDTV